MTFATDKSFVAWLDVARVTDDPEGDLVYDLRRDRQLPPAISSLADLRSHMRRRGACREALEAAPGVWGAISHGGAEHRGAKPHERPDDEAGRRVYAHINGNVYQGGLSRQPEAAHLPGARPATGRPESHAVLVPRPPRQDRPSRDTERGQASAEGVQERADNWSEKRRAEYTQQLAAKFQPDEEIPF